MLQLPWPYASIQMFGLLCHKADEAAHQPCMPLLLQAAWLLVRIWEVNRIGMLEAFRSACSLQPSKLCFAAPESS